MLSENIQTKPDINYSSRLFVFQALQMHLTLQLLIKSMRFQLLNLTNYSDMLRILAVLF